MSRPGVFSGEAQEAIHRIASEPSFIDRDEDEIFRAAIALMSITGEELPHNLIQYLLQSDSVESVTQLLKLLVVVSDLSDGLSDDDLLQLLKLRDSVVFSRIKVRDSLFLCLAYARSRHHVTSYPLTELLTNMYEITSMSQQLAGELRETMNRYRILGECEQRIGQSVLIDDGVVTDFVSQPSAMTLRYDTKWLDRVRTILAYGLCVGYDYYHRKCHDVMTIETSYYVPRVDRRIVLANLDVRWIKANGLMCLLSASLKCVWS